MSGNRRTSICFQFERRGTCQYGSQCKFLHQGHGRLASLTHLGGSSRRHRRRASHSEQSTSVDHIDRFFADYPNFDYDSSAPIWTEFNRMRDDFEWESDDYELKEAKQNFKSAMVQQFNSLYGTDQSNLQSWQNLCHILRIQPVPEELNACRKRVRQAHVNLVDLVDSPRTGEALEVFPSLEKLREYTIKTGKYFPKEDAYAGGLLRYLLREIINKRHKK